MASADLGHGGISFLNPWKILGVVSNIVGLG